MKKNILKYTTLLLTLTGFVNCESKSQFISAKNNKSLLWEVTGNELQKPVYIYGTMHLMCKQDALISDNLKKIIRSADEIYFEIDMDDFGQLLSGFSMGNMKKNTTLNELYTPEEYKRIEDFFKSHSMGMQLQMFGKMQPMLISALVYQAILPCSATDGIELNIMQVAHEYKKEIKGLETAAFQASILESIPYTTQAKELLYSIDNIDSTEIESEKMMQLYKEQDLEKLLDFSIKTDGGTTSDVQDVMINQRNKNWVDQFSQISKDKGLLIAVGAGHLGGQAGILNLLKQKGYQLRPIEN
ncbi:MAG: TraB/GumN family protein [Panacibacter sp.]